MAFYLDFSERTFPHLLRLLADEDGRVAACAWETLNKEASDSSINDPSPPESPEEGRRLAEEYRRLWEKQHHN
jgi:hypothetical protein